MGQYYKALIAQKDLSVQSDTKYKFKVYEWAWKMMEHSWYGNRFMWRIEKILSECNWNVWWVWDYSQMAPLCRDWLIEDTEDETYDDEHSEWYVLEHKANNYYYLVNHTKKEYISMTRQETNPKLFCSGDEWVVHPLSLLCRVDTEEAWWDYHSMYPNYDKQGYWAGDKIAVVEWLWSPRDKEMELLGYKDMTDILYFVEKEWVEL
jgi:hypothetical protein